jgi:hypothetical protein
MKSRFRLFIAALVVLLSVSVFLNVNLALSAGTPQPGSAEDPIISKSYVDAETVKLRNELLQLEKKYEEAVRNLQTALNELRTSGIGNGAEGFVVVELENGKKLLTGSGTELILRSGTAKALKGANGTLADTTSAADLAEGKAVSKNHLLISSRDDGRGIQATTFCYLLVRGGYRIADGSASTGTAPGTYEGGGASSETGGSKPAASTGTVTASALRIRAEASQNSEILGMLYKGDTVEILSEKNGWYQIKTKDSVTGWVLGQFLKIEK